MSQRILVTGATGFLGSNTLAALREVEGVRVIAACRTPEKLPAFEGEVRAGDLRDPGYRRDVVQDVDAVCHCGTWGAMWGHAAQERAWFYEPTIDLMEQSIGSGVGRFLLASSVAIAARPTGSRPIDDHSPGVETGYWPHLDELVRLDRWMRSNAERGTALVSMRLGHFVGRGNHLGLVPALVPRLRTRLVPWLAGGRKRLALVGGGDLGRGFALAATASGVEGYESFHICGPEFPTARDVFGFIAEQSGSPRPFFSVPQWAGYTFAWLMETLHPVLGGRAPFLTRAIVHVSEDWYCPSDHAQERLGYVPREAWRESVAEAIEELRPSGFPWPSLGQAVT